MMTELEHTRAFNRKLLDCFRRVMLANGPEYRVRSLKKAIHDNLDHMDYLTFALISHLREENLDKYFEFREDGLYVVWKVDM